MKSILLVGLGRFGRNVAEKLYEMKHQVMAVDDDEDRVSTVLPYVTSAQIGDSTKEEFLRSLGVSDYDVCIVAIGDDFQSSLQTTSLLKELGAKLVVARASSEVHEKFLLRNGADQVVYPERQLAEWTAIRFGSDRVFDYIELDEGHAIFEVAIPDGWLGKTVGALDIRRSFNINIIALKEGGSVDLNITPDTLLATGKTMLVSGSIRDIQKCLRI